MDTHQTFELLDRRLCLSVGLWVVWDRAFIYYIHSSKAYLADGCLNQLYERRLVVAAHNAPGMPHRKHTLGQTLGCIALVVKTFLRHRVQKVVTALAATASQELKYTIRGGSPIVVDLVLEYDAPVGEEAVVHRNQWNYSS
jgi:hypothetical protein